MRAVLLCLSPLYPPISNVTFTLMGSPVCRHLGGYPYMTTQLLIFCNHSDKSGSTGLNIFKLQS